MATDAQLNANRANAQHSTGPTSETGKASASRNALKTGLTGRTVLLPTEDAALYESHLAGFRARYQPVGETELNLVQSLADTEWRLQRIPSLEAAVYAAGRVELAGLFPDEEESIRRPLIEAKIFLTYQRQLNNLSIQENRLRRQREKDTAALKEIQEARKTRTAERLDSAAREYMEAFRKRRHEQFDPAEFGFEFSREEVHQHACDINFGFALRYHRWQQKRAA